MCMHMPLKTINFGEQLYIYIYMLYHTHTYREREHYTVYEYWRVQSYLLKHSISVKQNVFSAK